MFSDEKQVRNVSSEYFLLHLADTILVDQLSFGGLERMEIVHELNKRGYDKLSENELRKVDHELWRRLKKSKGQIRND